MSIFAIGDLHLSFDETVDKPMDVFGAGWTDHEDRIKENWIDNVREHDTVIIAGDVSWGLKLQQAAADFQWIDSLPGKKLIFKGNHDLWWNGINKMNSMFDSITFVQNTAVYAEGWYICGSRGWVCPGDPGYTEEDEKIYQSIMDDTVQENQLNSNQTNWLRDIKYRYFPQPKQEWSEGMHNSKTICNNCEDKDYCSQSEYVKNNCYKLK